MLSTTIFKILFLVLASIFYNALLFPKNRDYISSHIEFDRIYYLDETYNFNEKARYSVILNEAQVEELYSQQAEFYKLTDDNKLLTNKLTETIFLNICNFAQLPNTPNILLKAEKYIQMELFSDLLLRYFNTGKATGGRNEIICDFHLHTIYSHDSVSDIENILIKANEEGFGAIAVSDHNRLDGVKKAVEIAEQLKKAGKLNPGFIIIPAEEVSVADGGHIGALFIKTYIEKGMTAEETIREIHKQGGLAVALHPGKKGELGLKLSTMLDFDAVEVGDGSDFLLYEFYRNKKLGQKTKKTKLFGGNAHISEGLGFLGYNVVYTAEKSAEGIKQAIRNGTVRPVFTGVYNPYNDFFELKPVEFIYTSFDIYDTIKRNLEYYLGRLIFSNDFKITTSIDEPLFDIFNILPAYKYIRDKKEPFQKPVKLLSISVSYGMLNINYDFDNCKAGCIIKFVF
ncbi:MAG: PHP domain-containing protein [Elusimicrobiota bacterium]